MAHGGGGGPGGHGGAATRGGRGRAVDGRRVDGVAAVRRGAVVGRRDSRVRLWRGTGGGGPAAALFRAARRLADRGVRGEGGAMRGCWSRWMRWGRQGNTRGGAGEVTGGDQELAAPSGPFWFMT